MRVRIFALVLILASPAVAADLLDVLPPSARVRGVPGSMSIQPRECRTLPAADARARIVGVALQQWDFFGSRISDYAEVEDERVRRRSSGAGAGRGSPRRRRRESPRRSPGTGRSRPRDPGSSRGRTSAGPARTGSAPAGTRRGRRRSSRGSCARPASPPTRSSSAPSRTTPTSTRRCARATGARRRRCSSPATPGEAAIAPGDLLCSSRRPVYRTLAERRRQMGVGARSHCDVVVKVDEPRQRCCVPSAATSAASSA